MKLCQERNTAWSVGAPSPTESSIDALLGQPVLRFGWVDASPQCGRDWLMSSCDIVFSQHLAGIAAAIDALVAFTEEAPDEEASQLDGLLRERVQSHMHVPGALGSRAASLDHKMAVWVHGLSLETRGEAQLRVYLASFVSNCTDLGTEVGMTEYPNMDINDIDLHSQRPAA
eukprot:6609274-Lingulodinium_polyedra.AAC.1